MKRRIRLNASDYKKILEFYKLKIPTRSTLSNLKKRAEKALVEKICALRSWIGLQKNTMPLWELLLWA